MTSLTSSKSQKAETVRTPPRRQQSVSGLAAIELIRSITPLIFALIGCVLGIAVLITDSYSNVKTAGFGLASTAIAGAAGLAQNNRDNG